jgi:predicted transporter
MIGDDTPRKLGKGNQLLTVPFIFFLLMTLQAITTPKVLIPFLWNISDISVSKSLVDEFFNADYSLKHILRSILLLQIGTVTHKQKKGKEKIDIPKKGLDGYTKQQ